jgi:uncharacterized protein (UPF0335 family)
MCSTPDLSGLNFQFFSVFSCVRALVGRRSLPLHGRAQHVRELGRRNSKEQLKAFVERIERLEEEKKTIADDIRDVYAESKSNGFDVKGLRAIIRLRKQDAQKRAEHEAILDTYKHALGMLADLPLGQSAMERAHANG